MQSYELQRIRNLPDIIPVDYRYIGDRRPEANQPENFKTDFPDYIWHRFSRLKKLLNDSKEKLDKYVDTPEKSKKFTFITLHTKSMMSLKHNKLVTEYNSEIKSNAFLKMYEIMRWLKDNKFLPFCDVQEREKDVPLPKIVRVKNQEQTIYKTLSIAEAPGNFILALNHFIKTECPHVIWDWRASTFKTMDDDPYYFGDTYGIIKKFPDNWIYGIDGDGDITSVNNLETFEYRDVFSNYGEMGNNKKLSKKYNLVTSDVKYVPHDNIYSEEETINLPVMTGHTLASLINLEKGGSCVLKEFSLFECGTISLLYLLSYAFERVFVTKPASSKQANSEVYVVCTGFLDNLNREQIRQIKTYLTWIRFSVKPKKDMVLPALFRDIDMDEDWILDLIKINKELTERQIKELDEMVEIVDRYQKNPHLNAQHDFRLTNERLEDKWISENRIKRLNDEDKMMVLKNSYGANEKKCNCDKSDICVHKNQIRAILNTKSDYFRKAFLTLLEEYLTPEKIEELLAIYRQRTDTELYDFIQSNLIPIKETKETGESKKTIKPKLLIEFNLDGDISKLLPDIDTEYNMVKLDRFYLNDSRLRDLLNHLLNMDKTIILRDVDVDVSKSKNSQLLFDIKNILTNYPEIDLRPIYKTYQYPQKNTDILVEKIISGYEKDNSKKINLQIRQKNREFRIMISK